MKKIVYLIMGVALMGLASCMEIDNWDAPDATIYGNVIDSYTGQNLVTNQDEWKIRIWERTWTATVPTDQNLSVKQDGSYRNTKMFAGTYDMLPYDGPFWPTDTVKGVVFTKKGTEQNFTVTPYLQVIDFTADLNATKDSLTLTCRIKAPRINGLPDLREIKPFLSQNSAFCGVKSYIDIPEYNEKRIQINKSWANEVGTSETSNVYKIGPLPVKSQYTYYVRIGANLNTGSQRYNYSEVKQIVVP
jgi:hypothetical protein